MAAARYWRAVGLETYSGGDLEISELQLFDASGRVDDLAALSCTAAPTAGVLASLQDASFSVSVRFAASAVQAPGFAFLWDFGASAKDITNLRVGAAAGSDQFIAKLTLQSSADGVSWATFSTFDRIEYHGAFALSAAGVSVYASTVLEDAPVGYWRLDEVSGTTMLDASPNARHGTYGGLGTLGATGLIADGRAVSVAADGTATVATVANDAAFTLGADFSLEISIKTAAATGVLLSKETGGQTYPSWRLIVSGGKAQLNLFPGNGPTIGGSVTSIAQVNDGVGHHVVATRGGSALSMYVDGVLSASSVYSGGIWTNSSPVGVGCRYSPGYSVDAIVGTIDEVAIYGAALSAERVSAHYAARVASGTLATPFIRARAAPFVSMAAPGLPATTGVTLQSHNGTLRDMYFGGRGRVRGTVKEKGTPDAPVYRRVRLGRERDGMVIREQWSDPTTGAYDFQHVDELQQYTVVAYDHLRNYRAVIADNITPEIMPS